MLTHLSLLHLLLIFLLLHSVCASEESIREELGIPKDARKVALLCQSSHLDWDWLEKFDDYYKNKVHAIFEQTTDLLAQHSTLPYAYRYGIAEVGFLEKFLQLNSTAALKLSRAGQIGQFHLVGGGITTPDSLTNHPEAFLRNYLTAQKILKQRNLPLSSNAWFPDDFGHVSNLPTLIESMGWFSSGFSRIPGADNQGPAAKPSMGKSPAQVLKESKTTFEWKSNDGSTMIAHWMLDGYSQGGGMDRDVARPNDCASYGELDWKFVFTNIHNYIEINNSTDISPYSFVIIGGDFETPKHCLIQIAAKWNQQGTPTAETAFLAIATFDHYIELVSSYTANRKIPMTVREFKPTPYWTGFYASRPSLKILQQYSVRKLTSSESLASILKINQNDPILSGLDTAWTKYISPSTHHDFITGTSVDSVFLEEQLPMMKTVRDLSIEIENSALKRLIEKFTRPASNESPDFAVWNPLGTWIPSTIVQIPFRSNNSPPYMSFNYRGRNLPIQRLPESQSFLVYLIDVPPLSLASGSFSRNPPAFAHVSPSSSSITSPKKSQHPELLPQILDHKPSSNSKKPSPDTDFGVSQNDNSYSMWNAYLNVTFQANARWAITNLVSRNSGVTTNLISPTSTIPGAFNLEVIQDSGNIYRFGNEMPSCSFANPNFFFFIQRPIVTPGLLRSTLSTSISLQFNNIEYIYWRNYTLDRDSRMIKVAISGRAPPGTSVLVRTPLSHWLRQTADSAYYGNPYGWDNYNNVTYWEGDNFMSAHNFYTAVRDDQLPISFYSSTSLAWSRSSKNVVSAALFRNTPKGGCEGYGADGGDNTTEVHHIAIRPFPALSNMPDISYWRESLTFSNMIVSQPIANAAQLPQQSVIASFPQTGQSMITTAKPKDDNPNNLILRLFAPRAGVGPGFSSVSTTFTLPHPVKQALPVTSLENPCKLRTCHYSVTVQSPSTVTVTQSRPIATIEIVF